jgi:hypothetical protein
MNEVRGGGVISAGARVFSPVCWDGDGTGLLSSVAHGTECAMGSIYYP